MGGRGLCQCKRSHKNFFNSITITEATGNNSRIFAWKRSPEFNERKQGEGKVQIWSFWDNVIIECPSTFLTATYTTKNLFRQDKNCDILIMYMKYNNLE